MEQLGSQWPDFYEVEYLSIFRNSLNIKSRAFLLRMRAISDESCRENQNLYFVYYFSFYENCAVYEIMWKSLVVSGRPQMAI